MFCFEKLRLSFDVWQHLGIPQDVRFLELELGILFLFRFVHELLHDLLVRQQVLNVIVEYRVEFFFVVSGIADAASEGLRVGGDIPLYALLNSLFLELLGL
jgi:hypothetical protein